MEQLLLHVHNTLSKSKVSLKPFPTNSKGSLAQIPFNRRVEEDHDVEQYRRISQKSGASCSQSNFSVHIQGCANVCRFRCQRFLVGEEIDFLPYVLQNDQEFDPEWIAHAHDVFTYGVGGTRWNTFVLRFPAALILSRILWKTTEQRQYVLELSIYNIYIHL